MCLCPCVCVLGFLVVCLWLVLYLVSVVSVLSLCLLCMVFGSLVGACVLCPYCSPVSMCLVGALSVAYCLLSIGLLSVVLLCLVCCVLSLLF